MNRRPCQVYDVICLLEDAGAEGRNREPHIRLHVPAYDTASVPAQNLDLISAQRA